MAENGRKSGQNGPADSVPVPEKEGHLDKGVAPPFPAPREPVPLSTSTPDNISENISVKKSAPKKPGRKPGCKKTGGRKKPGPEPSGREARKFLEQNSGYLDLLCRMLRGKPIKRQGPTGKVVWYHPDFDDQKWALAQVLPRMIPTLASQELTGDAENPLAFKDAGEPLSMAELARRTAFIFDLVARETDESRRGAVAAPRNGATAQAAEGFCLSPSAAAPASDTPNGQDTPAEAPEPDREPVPGEVAEVGAFKVVCFEDGVPGRPPQYEIQGNPGGRICTNPGGGWLGVLKWIERKSPPGADMTVTITKPRPIGGEARPDERAMRSISAPVVVGSYANRKR